MSRAPRSEIEVRLFVFTSLGEMKQSGQLIQAVVDCPRLLAGLLHLWSIEARAQTQWVTIRGMIAPHP
jgi:hypothetical protein